jgi:hypothetical protein
MSEFQMRGSPHAHCLACVRRNGVNMVDITSEDPSKLDAVRKLVARTVTAELVDRVTGNNADLEQEDDTALDAAKEQEKRYDFTPT